MERSEIREGDLVARSETCRVLALAFSAALNAPVPETRVGMFRM